MGRQGIQAFLKGTFMRTRYTADDFNSDAHICAEEALERLREGNIRYVGTLDHERIITPELIEDLFENGQRPYATVITCSDSRVVPEHIFLTNIGELFVIRTAGNVVCDIEAASAFYACKHLHTKLLLVLGHTHCGAVKAAIDGERGPVAALTDRISRAIGDTDDPYEASVLNTEAAIDALMKDSAIQELVEKDGLMIRGAIYHTHCGVVDFL